MYSIRAPDINFAMRFMLVGWLFDLSNALRFTRYSMHMAVELLDTFLQIDSCVTRKTFQLAGAVCLNIAAKCEETVVPSTDDYLWFMKNTYTVKEFEDMEYNILSVLDFNVMVDTVLTTFDAYRKTAYSSILGKRSAADRSVAKQSGVNKDALYYLNMSLLDPVLLHEYSRAEIVEGCMQLAASSDNHRNIHTSACMKRIEKLRCEEVDRFCEITRAS